MKISREWLQTFFDAPLPDAAALSNALTFHAFEIESVEGDVLDVKVTPNRGHDCLCHRGIAKELSAILNVPMKLDPLRQSVALEPRTDIVQVNVEEAELCPRFTGAYIKGVKVGPSPEWLRTALEAIGQRSINNVVDATNYIMFNVGQPLHAFDAGKLADRESRYALTVKKAKEGERLVSLDGKEYALSASMLVIADGHTGLPVSIAGIKGGAPAAIDHTTESIVLEAANWNGVNIRKTSQALKLRTDASQRFEQVLSPELAAYGTRAAAQLIVELTGGEIVGFFDEYPRKQNKGSVQVSVEKVNRVLGTQLHESDVEYAFDRLGFAYEKEGAIFTVFTPFERRDLKIAEDLIEEVARIVGYDKIPAFELPTFPKQPEVNANFYSAEHAREELIAQGYSEVVTSVFADKGDRIVANKVDGVRPYLRRTLIDGLKDAYDRNDRTKAILGLQHVRIFEIGIVWQKGNELTMLGIADEKGVREEPLAERAKHYDTSENMEATLSKLPTSEVKRYQPFSKYPFIVRDIAMWVPFDAAQGKPQGTSFTDVVRIFGEFSQGLLRHVDLFDQFQKGDRVSYAFHLVFQSFDRTLTDAEANAIMQNITKAIAEKGFEVR